jgi:hypothetical protein
MKSIKHPLQVRQYKDEKWVDHIDKKQNETKTKVETYDVIINLCLL